MKNLTFLLICSLACALLNAANPPTPVLVELFTSEGCSSCPPADRLLAYLDKEQPLAGIEVVAMSEHVDYWNHDGWVDPFSSPEFTQRQQAYSLRFKVPEIYTPQMVVNGEQQCVGSSAGDVEALIRTAAAHPKLAMQIVNGEGAAKVVVTADGDGLRGDVFVGLADNDDQSDVLAGENRGLKLHHVAVIRKLRKIGKINKSGGFHGEISVAGFAGGRLIAFIQEPGGGQILGAAMYRIPR